MERNNKSSAGINSSEQKVEGEDGLRRELGLMDAMLMVIGMVIGSGIFFRPASVLKNAGAPGLGVLAWVAGGIITMAAGLTVAEVAAAIPKTGGLFIYLKKLYGEKWAFLLGWVQTFIYVPGSVAGLAIYFSNQATAFIDITKAQQIMLAIGMIVLVCIANVLSTKFGGKLQVVFTIAKLIPIIVIVIFGLLNGTAHSFAPISSSASNAAGFGAAMLGTLWAYDGWIGVGNIAGELKNPGRDLPKSIIIGLLITIVVYVLVNLAVLNILPADQLALSQKPVSDAAVKLFGNGGGAFISAGIMISIFGTLNGYLLSGSRIPFAMGQSKLIPFHGFFGKVNKGSGTPGNALIFESILAAIYALTGSADKLTDLAVFVLWIFFVMAISGVFILRKNHKDLARPYKVPLYPFIPILGIGGGMYILISTLLTNTANALYGIGITLLGIPVYIYISKKNSKV
jgi:APA family basic amino acid/polyamine antiporter